MPGPSRYYVAKVLEPLGLRRTLVILNQRDEYTVNLIKSLDQIPELICVGRLKSNDFNVIGRVGIPDPEMTVPWLSSLSFYGKWFDQIVERRVRSKLCATPHAQMLEQVGRDNQYALVGSYYSVFQTIMEVKKRVPFVLINDHYLSTLSFPVILADQVDAPLENDCFELLQKMLKVQRR